MRLRQKRQVRRGSVLPLVAVCCVAMMGMVALAIDIGMVAIARNQCQNAADSAAMAGARTITGNSTNNYNYDQVPSNAVKAAAANSVFGTNISGDPNTSWNDPAIKATVHPQDHIYVTGSVSLEVGSYAYVYNDGSPNSEGFQIQFPRADTTEPFSAVKATIDYQGKFAFGRVFGLNTYNAKASATAVHRPRDVIIVMDLSGSMRFQSLPGIPYYDKRTTSMQSDVYPKFGHYSDTTAAALYGNTSMPTGSNEMYDPTNLTKKTNSGDPIVDDFYQNNLGASPSPANRAFTRWNDSFDVLPGGDNFPPKNGSGGTPPANYAKTVNDWKNYGSLKNTTFETDATNGGYGSTFVGYTQGPGYWGKTFFMWPPDPRGATKTDMSKAADQYDNGAKDWRQRFFIKVRTSNSKMTPLDDNSLLWSSTGSIKTPGTSTTVTEVDATTRKSVSVSYTYRINYAAILHWLRTSPTPFPTQMRAGKIRYWDKIPDPSADSTINDRLWKTQNPTDANERLWRDYIDFILGFKTSGTSGGNVTYTTSYGGDPITAMIGNGDTYSWGTLQLKQKPNETTQADYITGGQINLAAGYSIGATALAINNVPTTPQAGDTLTITSGGVRYYYNIVGTPTKTAVVITPGLVVKANDNDSVTFRRAAPYMNYDDNPKRPKHHYWFGAQTLLDYLGNYNTGTFLWPGNVHEAQAWGCKVGIQSAIDDIKNNHPSDFIGLCYFSSPRYSASGSGQYNTPVVPLGRNYDKLKESLWFPPSTVNAGVAEIGVYDSDMSQVPRANGSTCPAAGFLLAYNLLSSSTSLRNYPQPQSSYRGVLGGLGRKGASRLVIFETDGSPNTGAAATLTGSGTDTYYKIRLYNPGNYSDSKNVEWPTQPSFNVTDTHAIVQQICALDTASPPGFATKRKPVLIYSIGYGSLFDPANSGSNQTTALTFLQTVQYYGGTSSDTNGANFPSNQRIYGPTEGTGGRIDRMQKAFSAIMQAGVQVSLIQ